MLQQNKLYPFVHPLKPITLGSEFPSQMEGDGIYLRDVSGKVCMDGISGLWNVSLGYRHPRIREAIVNQLDRLPFVNLVENTNPTTLLFAEQLLECMPEPLKKMAYTCTGSESVELAIKLARKYFSLQEKQEKHLIVSFDISYHGTYYGSMSASGIDQTISESYGPKVPGFVFQAVPFCNCCRNEERRCLERHLIYLDKLFAEYGNKLAAFIMEPILGSAGILPIPTVYMHRVKELCHQYDVLLILDEVATGFGRTGMMFAFEQYGVTPDILCLSKGINSGYLPLGAVIFSRKIYEVFANENSHIEHLSTQNGNPIACSAAIATLEAIREDDLLFAVNARGQLLKELLMAGIGNHKNFFEVRGKGLMIGVALIKSKTSLECLESVQITQLVQKLRQKGLLVYPFFTKSITTGFHLFPPFVITEEEVRKMAQIIIQVFNRTLY